MTGIRFSSKEVAALSQRKGPKATEQGAAVRVKTRPQSPPNEREDLYLVIPGRPIPKARARTVVDEKALTAAWRKAAGRLEVFLSAIRSQSQGGTRTGNLMRSFTPERTRHHEEAIAAVARLAMSRQPGPFKGNLGIAMLFAFEDTDPEAWPTAGDDGDVDNLAKAVMDALKLAGVYADDRQVVTMQTVKLCAAQSQTLVRLWTAPDRSIAEQFFPSGHGSAAGS